MSSKMKQKGFTQHHFLSPSNFKKNGAGFTLIELLVVISVIGMIASIALVSLNGARVKTRNTKRVADVGQLITAFNLGFNANGSLPSSSGGWVCVSATCYGAYSIYSSNAAVDAFLAPYINKPVDPDGGRNRGGFIYNSAFAGGTGYDGTVFPAGAYLDYVLEPPFTTGVCGPGKAFGSGAVNIECLYKFD